eukprot:1181451-Prorocentrum_minimum.AAC.3
MVGGRRRWALESISELYYGGSTNLYLAPVKRVITTWRHGDTGHREGLKRLALWALRGWNGGVGAGVQGRVLGF